MRQWLWVLMWLSVGNASQSTHLLVFGGGDLPQDGVQRLVELAKGENPHILYIPWADEDDFTSRVARLRIRLNEEFPVKVSYADKFEVVEKDIPEFIRNLPQYTGVYFGGGIQTRVMEIMDAHQDLFLALKAKYLSGTVFSGNSAGLAIMSQTMITGEGSLEEIGPNAIETRSGMGLVRLAVLDQHYIRRNRVQRLLSVLMGARERYGIGVDENTGVYIKDGRDVEVVGDRSVVVVDSAEVPGKFTVQVLKAGAKFTLESSPSID